MTVVQLSLFLYRQSLVHGLGGEGPLLDIEINDSTGLRKVL